MLESTYCHRGTWGRIFLLLPPKMGNSSNPLELRPVLPAANLPAANLPAGLFPSLLLGNFGFSFWKHSAEFECTESMCICNSEIIYATTECICV